MQRSGDMVLGLASGLHVGPSATCWLCPGQMIFPSGDRGGPQQCERPIPLPRSVATLERCGLSCDLFTSACGRRRCHGGGGLRYASCLLWSGVAAVVGRLSWTARSHSFFTVT